MKKSKYIFLIALLMLFPYTVFASCTSEELSYYKENKDQYKVTYEFNKDTKKFTLILNRKEPSKFEYIVYIGDNKKCEDVTDTIAKCYDIDPGKYVIELVGQTPTCNDVAYWEIINLNYNKYYEDPLCQGFEEFYLCDPNYDKEVDYETFVERITVYKKTKQREEDKLKEKEKDTKTSQKIINYIKDNILMITVIIAFVITLIITVILMAKSIKKSRRLE